VKAAPSFGHGLARDVSANVAELLLQQHQLLEGSFQLPLKPPKAHAIAVPLRTVQRFDGRFQFGEALCKFCPLFPGLLALRNEIGCDETLFQHRLAKVQGCDVRHLGQSILERTGWRLAFTRRPLLFRSGGAYGGEEPLYLSFQPVAVGGQ